MDRKRAVAVDLEQECQECQKWADLEWECQVCLEWAVDLREDALVTALTANRPNADALKAGRKADLAAAIAKVMSAAVMSAVVMSAVVTNAVVTNAVVMNAAIAMTTRGSKHADHALDNATPLAVAAAARGEIRVRPWSVHRALFLPARPWRGAARLRP